MIFHMIGNAHLDPVWLWPWPEGCSEAIGTCWAAIDRLDEHLGRSLRSAFTATRRDTVELARELSFTDPRAQTKVATTTSAS